MPWPWDKCKHIISYDGENISFSGLQLPNEMINFKIGSLAVKKELLQAASQIAQLYDLFQFSNCQRIQQFSKGSPQRDIFISEIQKNESRLAELIVMLKLATANPSEKIEQAIADWIAFNFTKGIREDSPISIEKGHRGGQRELPPISELNRIRRILAIAKGVSPYMANALRHPEFNIQKAYEASLEQNSRE